MERIKYMENEIIDVEATVIPENEPTDKTLKLVDELNSKLSSDKGQWIHDEKLGIVWQPKTGPYMPSNDPTREYQLPTNDPPPSLGELIKWGNTLDFDNIPQNAVVLIKLDINDPFRVQMMQRIITKQVLEPKIEKLKEKHTCILFMQAGDDISVMTEEEMKKAGWEKKEKSIIITP